MGTAILLGLLTAVMRLRRLEPEGASAGAAALIARLLRRLSFCDGDLVTLGGQAPSRPRHPG